MFCRACTHIDNCFELKNYKSVMSEVKIRLQSSSQQNLIHYFAYNRLMDLLTNNFKQCSQRSNQIKQLFGTIYIDLFIIGTVDDRHDQIVIYDRELLVACISDLTQYQ